jgi:hypothetical protein
MESSERGKANPQAKEDLQINKGLRDVLGTSLVARSRLDVLLERPRFLNPEQKGELQALVGPDWRQLGIDIERYRSWSERASALLRSIDLTPLPALSDSEWKALLGEARKAVDEADIALRRISFSADVEMGTRSIRGPAVPATRKIVGPEVPATRKIVGPEVPATRKIAGPEERGRSARDRL